jgi:hypothetical protein
MKQPSKMAERLAAKPADKWLKKYPGLATVEDLRRIRREEWLGNREHMLERENERHRKEREKYKRNREKILADCKKRYREDPAYRAQIFAGMARHRAKKKAQREAIIAEIASATPPPLKYGTKSVCTLCRQPLAQLEVRYMLIGKKYKVEMFNDAAAMAFLGYSRHTFRKLKKEALPHATYAVGGRFYWTADQVVAIYDACVPMSLAHASWSQIKVKEKVAAEMAKLNPLHLDEKAYTIRDGPHLKRRKLPFKPFAARNRQERYKRSVPANLLCPRCGCRLPLHSKAIVMLLAKQYEVEMFSSRALALRLGVTRHRLMTLKKIFPPTIYTDRQGWQLYTADEVDVIGYYYRRMTTVDNGRAPDHPREEKLKPNLRPGAPLAKKLAAAFETLRHFEPKGVNPSDYRFDGKSKRYKRDDHVKEIAQEIFHNRYWRENQVKPPDAPGTWKQPYRKPKVRHA